jgi:hypothetical protein
MFIVYSSITFLHMNTSIKAILAVFFVTAFALAPLVSSSAMAIKNGDSTTTTTCTHNGNGAQSSGECSNPSGTTSTTTCTKIHGKFVCTTG